MTTPKKVYHNYRFDELIAFSEHNPHRNRTLSPIEISVSHRAKANDTLLDGLGLKGYTAMDVQPTGILSILLCMDDPMAYSLSSPASRTQQVMDLCTHLQEKTDELRNGPLMRKRKRIYELLGAVYNESTLLEEKDYLDLFHAMEYLMGAHFIMMKSTVQEKTETDHQTSSLAGELFFSSSPLLWKRDRPVWAVDLRCHWMAVPTHTSIPLASYASEWLPMVEEKGWMIHWPEVEGTKTELVEQASAYPDWKETDKKLTKEVLAQRLGKRQTLQWFKGVA